MDLFKELIELSLKERKGITIFIKGQTIGGAVTKIIGTEAIELRSQMYSRIIVKIDAIEAMAIN